MTEDDREVLAELTALADDLLEEAESIRRQWTELSNALGVDVPEPATPAPDTTTGAPTAERERERQPVAPPTLPDEDPIRLVALDMMLSGRSRADIEQYLRQTFGDGVRPEILDDVFDTYT